MTTQDAVNQFVSQLQALASPPANAAQISSLQSQITSLLQQIISLQQQIIALRGPDGELAQQTLNAITPVLRSRIGVAVNNAQGNQP